MKPSYLTEWEYFAYRHQKLGNVIMHHLGLFGPVVALALLIATGDLIWLVAFIITMPLATLGHFLFDDGTIRAADFVRIQTITGLCKITYMMVIGSFKPELSRIEAKANQFNNDGLEAPQFLYISPTFQQNTKALVSISMLLILTVFAVLYPIGILLMPLLIWPWFSIFHSLGHNAYFTNRKLNDYLGFLISPMVGIPFYSWKIHHATHHKWTGYLGKDPTSVDIDLPSKDSLKFYNWLWKLWIPFMSIGHALTHLLNPWSLKEHCKKSKTLYRKVWFSFLMIFTLHALLIITLGWDFYLPWMVAMVFFLITGDLILLSQHALLPMKRYKDGDKTLKPETHLRYTRSITFGKFCDRYLMLNFNEHSSHHMTPNRPHWELRPLKVENRVEGLKWIKTIKSKHLYDVLNTPLEDI